ncbi:MAG: hypothetical protein P1V51_07415 [Deltaproteobacteria bacterium]|nr:hypothetical protein [Deltaproteobacteria bacterium]
MTAAYRLPGGAVARLMDPRVPFLPHYRVLVLETPASPGDEVALLALARQLARRLGQEALGDPEAFSVLFNGARTRRVPRAHVHLLPSGSVAGKRWGLLFLSLKRGLRAGRDLLLTPRTLLRGWRVGLRRRYARWRLARLRSEAPTPLPVPEREALAALFAAAWQALGCKGDPAPAFGDLVRRHAEPHRRYHTLTHVQALLAGLERHPGPVEDRAALQLAIFFHDAIQVPGGEEDEQASAALARQQLEGGGADPVRLAAIEEAILATRHRAAPAPGDPSLMVDLDLSILGALPGDYDAYLSAVRSEWAWVSHRRWRRGRRRLLEGWLARPALFLTPDHRARLEARARANLERELASL